MFQWKVPRPTTVLKYLPPSPKGVAAPQELALSSLLSHVFVAAGLLSIRRQSGSRSDRRSPACRRLWTTRRDMGPPLLLLLMSVATAVSSSCVDRPCAHCPHMFSEGDICGTSLLLPYLYCEPVSKCSISLSVRKLRFRLVKESPNEYLSCDDGQLVLQKCPMGAIFAPGQGCTDPTMHLHMHGLQVSGSGRVVL